MTSMNYEEAVALLKKRFGNPQQIINKHMDELLNLEPVTSYNIKSLRGLCDQVESNVRSLKSLGVSSSSYGCLLSSIIMSKLPQDLRLVVSRKIKDDMWDLEEVMEVIEHEIDAREREQVLVLELRCPHQKHPRRHLRNFTLRRRYCPVSSAWHVCIVASPIQQIHVEQ